MPTIYPIGPPVHEMNFVTTMVSRLEGIIMQLTAEIDYATLKVRKLMLRDEEAQLAGLDLPDLSVSVTTDDEANWLAGVTASTANKLDPNAKYREDEYRHNLHRRGVVDRFISTLTGWITPDEDRIWQVARQHKSNPAHRLDEAYDPQTLQWLSFQPGDGSSIPERPAMGLAHKRTYRGEILPLRVVTSTDWMLDVKNEYFRDTVLVNHARNRISQFMHDHRMWTAITKAQDAEWERNHSDQHIHFFDRGGKKIKMYDESMQMTLPFDLLMYKLIDNMFEAKRNFDPIDRTKKWYHYQSTDARPQTHPLDIHTNRHHSDWGMASIILDEKRYDELLTGGTPFSFPTRRGTAPLMQARQEMFLNKFPRLTTGAGVNADMSIADRFKFDHDIDTWQQFKAREIKSQVENAVTLDNLDRVNHANKIIHSATHSGNKIAISDVYSMDRYVEGYGPHMRLNNMQAAERAWHDIPTRTAGYDYSGRNEAGPVGGLYVPL